MRCLARSTGPASRPDHTPESPVGWSIGQAQARERYWPDVERLISALPPRLFRQAKLLEYDLALRYSDTGQFKDIFFGLDQFPILSIGGWLLDDLGVAGGPERERAEPHLFLASVLIAARADTIERIADPASFYDHEHLAVIAFLSERAALELARVVPPVSAFWRDHDAISARHLDTVLEELERDRGGPTGDDAEATLRGRWSAPARLLASAVMALARADERPDEGAQAQMGARVDEIGLRVGTMLDDLAAAFQIRSDLAAMHHDLQRGRATFPIVEIARAAGVPLRPWPKPDVLLGAMVVTGSLGRILDQAVGHVRDAHRTAAELGLATFTAYLGDAEAAFEERARMAGAGTSQPAQAPGRGKPAAPLITSAEPTLPKALSMAEGFLLSDLTFKESWETHREGMFGSPEVASRFPTGMILEILCRHGHALSGPVDAFLSFTAANGFRYYDHPWSGADSDTVGVLLRLQRHATSGSQGTAALDGIFGCLERQVRTSGSVPVWIATDDAPEPSRPRSSRSENRVAPSRHTSCLAWTPWGPTGMPTRSGSERPISSTESPPWGSVPTSTTRRCTPLRSSPGSSPSSRATVDGPTWRAARPSRAPCWSRSARRAGSRRGPRNGRRCSRSPAWRWTNRTGSTRAGSGRCSKGSASMAAGPANRSRRPRTAVARSPGIRARP